MSQDICIAHLRIDPAELRKGEYGCDPALCKNRVCCSVFDIAVTQEEEQRLRSLLPLIEPFCPWLSDGEDPILHTPWELFLRKRADGLCWFNFRDEEGRAWCGIHAAALKAGVNPYAWKPLNCAVWPFLRDGSQRLTLDEDSSFPCLRNSASGHPQDDPELLALLSQLAESLGTAPHLSPAEPASAPESQPEEPQK